MKKLAITIIAVLALTLAGCRKQPSTQQEIDADIARRIKVFNYQGHRYLLYQRPFGHSGVACITHDPDCPCHDESDNNK